MSGHVAWKVGSVILFCVFEVIWMAVRKKNPALPKVSIRH